MWWTAFTLFVGGAMVWFAATGFYVMANALYWIGSEPRLAPDHAPSGRCVECNLSLTCVKHPQATSAPALVSIGLSIEP